MCLLFGLLSGLCTGCGRAPANGQNDAPAPLPRLELRAVGGAAKSLLRAKQYTKLVVEVASVKGREPSRATLNYLQAFLSEHLNKPDGIQIVAGRTIAPTGTSGLTSDDLVALEAANRTQTAAGAAATVFIMFLDNHDAQDEARSKVLGLSYQATSIVIYEDTLKGMAVDVSRSLTEKTVLAHEFGHLFGLVNTGAPMAGTDHYDHEHAAGHCANTECLMNFAVHTSQVWSLFGEDDVPEFDEECLADLEALGAKSAPLRLRARRLD